MKLFFALGAALLTLTCEQAAATQPFGILAARAEAERPAMLILGTPHFNNPGRDMVNRKIEDVTTPERQREIEALVDRLASFHPTHVAVEWSADSQDKLDKRYADYRAGRYELSPDERDQIGLRLAARLDLPRVDAVDWFAEPPGEDADYDFYAWASEHGMAASLQASTAARQAEADARTARMRCTSVSDWLREMNTSAARADDMQPYFDIALVGGPQVNPGATWVGNWYARNLKIFANLVRIADKPDDRVVVIYGAGHAPLLDEFARQSRGFDVVDTLDYLPQKGSASPC